MKAPVFYVLFAQSISAHYLFSHFIFNNTVSKEWEYVREMGPSWEGNRGGNLYRDAPQQGPIDKDLTCGYGAWKNDNETIVNKTRTADVVAGSEVGFRVSQTEGIRIFGENYTSTDPVNPDPKFKYVYNAIYHPGVVQAYMSRADDLTAYQADGDWFKIMSRAAINASSFFIEGYPALHLDVNFTIPRTVPPGKYLLRFEHLVPDDRKDQQQWFTSCAHVNVMGPGGGTPTALIKFPEGYKWDDPGILISPDFDWYYHKGNKSLMEYVAPGPPVFIG